MHSTCSLTRILLLTAFFFSCATAQASILGFGDFSQFSVNLADSGSLPTVSPGKIELTNAGNDEVRSVFFNTPQSISKFTASFTYQATSGPNIQSGAAFVLENSTQSASAVGFNGYGYGGILHSAAITLALGSPAQTALYTGGVIGGGTTATTPVSLISGDPIGVGLVYDGSVLKETLTDLVTSAKYSTSYLVNLQAALGGTTAFVGVTAGTTFGATQDFSDFQYITPEPTSLVLLCSGAAVVVASRYRRRCK